MPEVKVTNTDKGAARALYNVKGSIVRIAPGTTVTIDLPAAQIRRIAAATGGRLKVEQPKAAAQGPAETENQSREADQIEAQREKEMTEEAQKRAGDETSTTNTEQTESTTVAEQQSQRRPQPSAPARGSSNRR
jgi:hypothetical protein